MLLSKNNNNEHAEYHGISIPFKSQIYSKQESHISLLFGTWTLVLFPHVWKKPKFLLLTLTWQRLHENIKFFVFLTGFSCTLFTKTLLLFRISLLKRFIYRRVTTSYRFSLVLQLLSRLPRMKSKQYLSHFIRKKVLSSKVLYCLPTRKI